ncbi:MAG: YbhB/YbcL family Raf kinase inhibitor-like protein [Propionicimonas sp.]|uniref:YbhB/YbcL family Raf kinase inhibitor-like protein n=1 Tax=Propionicimonas sp. TaxID=1955623 RepID=UPI003D09D135
MHPLEALLLPLGRLFRGRHADEARSISHRPELATTSSLGFGSPRFGDGQEIPARYCGRLIGDNLSPALSWTNLPAATADLLLVMEDLDSPGESPRLHAVAAFAPEPGRLDDGALNAGSSQARFLRDGHGPLAYSGPRPLPGHGPHHYRFHLCALDRRIDIDQLDAVGPLLAAVQGHVLASATITGTRET